MMQHRNHWLKVGSAAALFAFLLIALVPVQAASINGEVTAVYPARNIIVIDRVEYRVAPETQFARQSPVRGGGYEPIPLAEVKFGQRVLYSVVETDSGMPGLEQVLVLRERAAGQTSRGID